MYIPTVNGFLTCLNEKYTVYIYEYFQRVELISTQTVRRRQRRITDEILSFAHLLSIAHVYLSLKLQYRYADDKSYQSDASQV